MKKTVKTADRGDQTRSALVQAALAAFSEKGFHGVSTREIAGTAQVNQALIGRSQRRQGDSGRKGQQGQCLREAR